MQQVGLAERLAALMLVALAACDGAATRGAPPIDAHAGADTVDADAGAPVADAVAPRPDVVDLGPPPEPVTEQLPRPPADPKLTRRLVAGPALLVGGEASSCSHEPGAASDRWCAFSRRTSDTTAELWVVDITRALAETVTCDGSSPHCRRLSTDLWTGTSLWGPSYPMAQRFEDDTLIFHTGPRETSAPLHEGPIWAWRPSWPAPLQLTGAKGVRCLAQPRTRAVVCVDNAVIDKDPTSLFDRPRLRELDLLAGTLDDAGAAPLAKVARLTNLGAESASRMRLSPNGEYLAFSRVREAGMPETVELIKLADAGKATPTTIASDAANWEIAHDGSKLYYLTGFDRSKRDLATGTLMLADFPLPGGANPVELGKDVYGFTLLGSHDEEISAVERGVAFFHGITGATPNVALVRDRARPTDVVELSSTWDVSQIATDVRHSLVYRQLPRAEFPVAFVARNDGSGGSCQLTSDTHAETYGGHFTDSGRAVAWIEYGRAGSQSEEGWYGRPESCDGKTKFGDFVFGFRLIDDDFVVFEGGDLEDSTSWLQYTPLGPTPGGTPLLPAVVKEKPNSIVDIVRAGAGGKDVYIVFSTSHGGPAEEGLYLHGPLRAPAP